MSETELLKQVEWVLDDAQSSDDEFLSEPAPIARKIPKYNEVDSVEDVLQKKYDTALQKSTNKKVEELMKKSIIVPGFEQLNAVPPPITAKRTLIKKRRKEKEATKGPGWFNLPVQEITEEVKNDLDLLKMRSILDPKHFYKKNDITHTPKYFQVGTIVEGPADFYNSRIPKSQRKKTLVEELMADAAAAAHQKRKYKNIVDSSRHARPKRYLNTNIGKKDKKEKKAK